MFIYFQWVCPSNMLLLGTTRLLIFKNFSCQHIYSEQKFSWMLRKSQILSTLHQFPSKMYITYLPSHIHTIFKRFSPPTCLLDFTFCPSSMFIPSNMFIRFCLFALPTLLFHPTRLLRTQEYIHKQPTDLNPAYSDGHNIFFHR